MNRRKQLWWLIGLSATTALAQYVIQGALATGGDPTAFPVQFWWIDYGLWGARALIEAWVIVYLFQTRAQTTQQGIILTAFEVSLIGIITLTLGPALRSLGYGVPMRAVGEPWFTAWNFGIAAYTSLMMGAAGYAYRVQPTDESEVSDNSEVAELQLSLDRALAQEEEYRRRVDNAEKELQLAREAMQQVSTFAMLSPPAQARLIAAIRGEDGPTNVELAKLFEVHQSTIGRWMTGEDR